MRCETTVGTEKRKRPVGASLNAINYRDGARGEITYFKHRAKRVKSSELLSDTSLMVYKHLGMVSMEFINPRHNSSLRHYNYMINAIETFSSVYNLYLIFKIIFHC